MRSWQTHTICFRYKLDKSVFIRENLRIKEKYEFDLIMRWTTIGKFSNHL